MSDGNPSVNSSSDFGVVLGSKPQRQTLRCSFCGLGEGEVARLFEGHSGYICDECVDVCIQLLQDYLAMGIRPPKPPRAKLPWYKKILGDESDGSSSCSFNIHDRSNLQGERLFPGINARICDKCIRACDELKSSLMVGG